MPKPKKSSAAGKEQRKIRTQVAGAEVEAKKTGKKDGAMQSGARPYPEPPFPKQHQRKPGKESSLDPSPMYEAPFYKGSGKLEGLSAIITGGDSGIGRSVAVLFAREVADVAILYLDEHGDAEATKRAVEGEGRKCLLIPGDVRNQAVCTAAVAQTVKAFGKLDILVNNAAFQVHSPTWQFDRELRVGDGLMGNKDLLDYSMTKGGIHAFTRSVATHLIPKGIRVNAVAPGPVWTPLNPSDKVAEDVAQFGGKTPMRRPAQPEEISPAFVFLASNQCSSYITGEVLPIIGGYGGG